MANPYGTGAWRRARAQALERARHRCERCGRRGRKLIAHHVTDGMRPDHPNGLDPRLLRVLCYSCHELVTDSRSLPRGAGGRG
jgi:hypothetical protein